MDAGSAFMIVSSSREDRRDLFDALDGGAFDTILTARDFDQANSLLDHGARPALVIVEFSGSGEDALALGRRLLADAPNLHGILGLLPHGSRHDTYGWGVEVAGVRSWLRSPIDQQELRHVIALCEGPSETLSPAVPVADPTLIEQALELLNGVDCLVADDARNQQGLALLCGHYGIEFLTVLRERGGQESEPQELARFQGGALANEDEALWNHQSYHMVMQGKPLVLEDKAWERVKDVWVQRHRIASWAGLPLHDDQDRTVGALLAGSRTRWTRSEPVLATLRNLAERYALSSLVHHYRIDSRFRGLHDSLTKLPNRLLFNDRLESALAEAQRNGEQFSVLFVDLDRFKTINDSLGHAVGDQMLVAVAKRLRATVRASDTVARYAGDEFTLVLRHIIQRDDVLRIAEKITRVLEAPLTLSDGSEMQITASIGIAFFPEDSTTADGLVKCADVAMYNAKGMGRNTFRTFVAGPEDSHQQRLGLESKLRQAEKNNELRVYYQPQVDAESEDIVGMEALVRWEHPELGLISPGFFIPLAEETGLIIPIGEWVLRAACFDTVRWHEQFGLPLRVSVNLSALQIKQPNLLQVVKDALRDSGLAPESLDLEVTESINIKSIPNLIEILSELRALGCNISIDDFGTGQSSLDYLKHFPADRIKIDQTFVRNIGIDPTDEAIVRATIDMAHNMNCKVIAEGVEMEDHLRFLCENACEEMQGFLFCRPLPAASFENLLLERERLLAG
ncbi:MAG: EAL domain-containing protein [Xanthomonadales bacterium]|nr:EAL domain-containing protein [Xanthomonadales bacterium]MCB1642152.1 EAL domain-containing protein [Xanthomonadales bacterium]